MSLHPAPMAQAAWGCFCSVPKAEGHDGRWILRQSAPTLNKEGIREQTMPAQQRSQQYNKPKTAFVAAAENLFSGPPNPN